MINLSLLETETIIWTVKSNNVHAIKKAFATPASILLAYDEGFCEPIYKPTGSPSHNINQLGKEGDNAIVEYDPNRGIVYLGIPDQGCGE